MGERERRGAPPYGGSFVSRAEVMDVDQIKRFQLGRFVCGCLRLSNHHLVGPAAAARAKFARNQVEAALASFQARALEALGGDWDAEKV